MKKRNYLTSEICNGSVAELGVTVDYVNHDIFSEKDIFFSYRRSSIQKHKDYGRCISVIKLI